MNILPLLLFSVTNSSTAIRNANNNYEIGQSLLYVIGNFFTKQGSSFTIHLACDDGPILDYFQDLIEIIYTYQDNMKMQLNVNNHAVTFSKDEEWHSNLLLVDSFESFLKVDPALKVRNYDTNEYYHILLQSQYQNVSYDIQQILDYCWKNHLINVNIQVQGPSGGIIIYTYFPFTETHCAKVVPVEINRFVNGNMISLDLFPQKLLNMHRCPVNVATWDIMPYMKAEHLSAGQKLDGFEGKMLLQISKQMNFEIHIIVPPNGELRGLIANKNNESTGAIKMLRARDADMSLGCFQFDKSRTHFLTASKPYFQATTHAIFLTDLSLASTIASLWFPFEELASQGLFAATFIVLCLLYALLWVKRKFFEIHQRSGQHNVCLNLLASSLGMSSGLVLLRNYSRIFIMTWLVFVLVIRTEYGAIIYHFTRNNLFKRPPSTMQDMIKLGYKFALARPLYESVRQTSVFSDTGLEHIVVSDAYEGGVFKFLIDHPHEKLATIAPLVFLSYYAVDERQLGVLSFLKESLISHHYCVYFTKHSFLIDRFNFLVQRVVSVGLIDAWVKETIGWSQFTLEAPPHEVTVGQEELENVYYLCETMLGLSILVFCLEVMSVKSKVLRSFFERF